MMLIRTARHPRARRSQQATSSSDRHSRPREEVVCHDRERHGQARCGYLMCIRSLMCIRAVVFFFDDNNNKQQHDRLHRILPAAQLQQRATANQASAAGAGRRAVTSLAGAAPPRPRRPSLRSPPSDLLGACVQLLTTLRLHWIRVPAARPRPATRRCHVHVPRQGQLCHGEIMHLAGKRLRRAPLSHRVNFA